MAPSIDLVFTYKADIGLFVLERSTGKPLLEENLSKLLTQFAAEESREVPKKLSTSHSSWGSVSSPPQ